METTILSNSGAHSAVLPVFQDITSGIIKVQLQVLSWPPGKFWKTEVGSRDSLIKGFRRVSLIPDKIFRKLMKIGAQNVAKFQTNKSGTNNN